MKAAVLPLALLILVPRACADDGKPRPSRLPATCEVVMSPGMRITATTPSGKIVITAVDEVTRAYTWEGATRAVEMEPHQGRYFGSLGLHHEGMTEHWRGHRGITRCFSAEGQLHVKTVAEMKEWIEFIKKERGITLVFRNDGLAVGWGKFKGMDLYVEVWQFLFDGKKPKQLPGSHDDRIVVETVEVETVPLVKAVAADDLAKAKAILDHGADANVRNSVEIPVLVMAIRRRSVPMVDALLKHGANPNVRDLDTDVSPLMEATVMNAPERKELVKRLLRGGADVNASIGKNGLAKGLTPLILAVGSEDEDLIRLLLDKGANVNARMPDGLTVLSWAKLGGDEEGKNQAVIRMLEAAGAKE